MFFGNGVRDPWLALFATHPPLDERIHAIDPGFQPVAVTETPAEAVPEPPSPRQAGMPVIGGILVAVAIQVAWHAQTRVGEILTQLQIACDRDGRNPVG